MACFYIIGHCVEKPLWEGVSCQLKSEILFLKDKGETCFTKQRAQSGQRGVYCWSTDGGRSIIMNSHAEQTGWKQPRATETLYTLILLHALLTEGKVRHAHILILCIDYIIYCHINANGCSLCSICTWHYLQDTDVIVLSKLSNLDSRWRFWQVIAWPKILVTNLQCCLSLPAWNIPAIASG